MSKPIMLIEPTDNYLDYPSCVMHEIAQQYVGYYNIVEIQGGSANPSNINNNVIQYDPILVWGTGHGSSVVYTVQNLQPYLSVGSVNDYYMMNRILGLTSCETALELGPYLVNNGVAAYYGYDGDFLFWVNSKPCCKPPECDYCTSISQYAPFLADAGYITSLLNGNNTGKASEDWMNAYDYYIKLFTSGEASLCLTAPLITNMLIVNKSRAKFIGNPNTSVSLMRLNLPDIPQPPVRPQLTVLGIELTPTVVYAVGVAAAIGIGLAIGLLT